MLCDSVPETSLHTCGIGAMKALRVYLAKLTIVHFPACHFFASTGVF